MSAGWGSLVPGKTGMGLGVAVARPGARPSGRRVIGAGGLVFAGLMALSARYGFHRDELYMPGCSRLLQASHVDRPVLAPAWSLRHR